MSILPKSINNWNMDNSLRKATKPTFVVFWFPSTTRDGGKTAKITKLLKQL